MGGNKKVLVERIYEHAEGGASKVFDGFHDKVPNPVFLYEVNQLKENSPTFNHDILSFANVDPNFPMPEMFKKIPGTVHKKFSAKGGEVWLNGT